MSALLKSLRFETKAGEGGRFEGYASLFDRVDLNGDVIAPGAFAASLDRRGPAGVKLLFQHSADEPLGFWERLEEDARGLFCVGALMLETAKAREVWALLKAGVVDGLSIGFETRRALRPSSAETRAGAKRRLVEIDLWEVSLVTFPMAPEARVVRIHDDPLEAFTDPETADAALALREAASALAHFD